MRASRGCYKPSVPHVHSPQRITSRKPYGLGYFATSRHPPSPRLLVSLGPKLRIIPQKRSRPVIPAPRRQRPTHTYPKLNHITSLGRASHIEAERAEFSQAYMYSTVSMGLDGHNYNSKRTSAQLRLLLPHPLPSTVHPYSEP